jgi:hypothetical protein
MRSKKYRLVWRKWPQEHPNTKHMTEPYYWFLFDTHGRCVSVNNTVEQAMWYLPRKVPGFAKHH